MLQPAEEVSHKVLFSDVRKHAQPNLQCTEQISDPIRHQTQQSSETMERQGAGHGLRTLNEDVDWLTLTLKFPAKPAVNVPGVGRDDLRLSLDMKVAAAPPAMEDLMEVQLREENDLTIIGTVPLVIITAAEDSGCDTLPVNLMGSTNCVLPTYCHPPAKEPNSVDQRLAAHIRGKPFHERWTLEPFKLTVNPSEKAELSDSLFDDHTTPLEKGVLLRSYPQTTGFDNFGVKGGSVHQPSCVHIVGHSPRIAARSRPSRKPMLQRQNDLTVMNFLSSQAMQIYTVGKGIAVLDKLRASSNPIPFLGKSELPCPSITWDLNDRPGTSGYYRSSCPRQILPEYVSAFPCSLQEDSQLSPNNESSLVEVSGSSGAQEVRHKLAPVVGYQNLAGLPNKSTVKEQFEHCHMGVSVPWQPSDNELNTPGKLASIKSKLEGVCFLQSSSALSNRQNVPANSWEGRDSVGVKFCLAAQVSTKSRTQGHLGSLQCEGLYLNDVSCCSSRLPPRQASSALYAHRKVDKVRCALGKIVDQVFVVEDSDIEASERIPLDSCNCPESDAVNNEGEGEILQVGPEYKRTDVKIKGYITRIRGILQDFEQLVKSQVRHSRGHFVLSGELQRSSNNSLVSCLLHSVIMELRPDSCKGKLAMPHVEQCESRNNKNHLKKSRRCTVTSLSRPEFLEKWKAGPLCDLCDMGESLSLGEWYAWCCGLPASRCWCPEHKKIKKQMAIGFRKTQNLKSPGNNISRHQWSGKVHKMCALWSSEVFQEDHPRKGNSLRLLEAAVKRGKSLFCRDPDCKKVGATLGCRVKNCRRSYHYPCAEKLASRCLLRMWDCLTIPIACTSHRHVEFETDKAMDKFLPNIVEDFSRDWKNPVQRWKHCLGSKLLSKDIAEGQEAVQIPCTNDVDGDPMPKIKYITKCWCKGFPVDNLHPVGTELASGCNGCGGPSFDCWSSPISVHILETDGCRESDQRLDWQSEYMHGRLPYNAYGLLQLGAESKDVVECNSRCKCGENCKNRELQKGLQVSLELFKTMDRGWGVRSLQQIPRFG